MARRFGIWRREADDRWLENSQRNTPTWVRAYEYTRRASRAGGLHCLCDHLRVRSGARSGSLPGFLDSYRISARARGGREFALDSACHLAADSPWNTGEKY